MIAKEELFLDFLGASGVQLFVPVYQRVYVWSERQCRALWADCMRAGASGLDHFIGTVLYAEEPGLDGAGADGVNSDGAGADGVNSDGACVGASDADGRSVGVAGADGRSVGVAGADAVRKLAVIDGQQRCATITLLLLALRDYLAEQGLSVGGMDAQELEACYLKVAGPSGQDGPAGMGKLQLGRADQATLGALLLGTELPEEDDLSQNVVDNYQLFKGLMAEGFDATDAETLLQGLHRLSVVAACVEEDDEPQLIFESLNGKGLPLTAGDLIRNLLLADEALEDQNRLYAAYWAPIERLYAGEDGDVRLTAAIRGWLAVTAPKAAKGATAKGVAAKGVIANGVGDDVYDAFKAYLRDNKDRGLENILIGLKGFCENFAAKAQAPTGAKEFKDWDTKRSGALISERKLFGD